MSSVPDPAPLPTRRRSLRDANLSGAIYGQILTLSVVAGLSEDREAGSRDLLVGTVLTMLVFWFAHGFADLLARRVTSTEELTPGEVWHFMLHEWPIAQAAVPAAVVLALATLGVLSRGAAITLAMGAGIVALFGWGILIGRRSGYSPPRTLSIGLVDVALGLAIVGLKLAIH